MEGARAGARSAGSLQSLMDRSDTQSEGRV
jgi:hypothetical protein